LNLANGGSGSNAFNKVPAAHLCKIEINFDASDFTLSYRKVFQIALVSEVTMAKKFVFTLK